MALRAGLVHGLRQFLGQDLAQLVDRDVVAGGELADGIIAEHGAEPSWPSALRNAGLFSSESRIPMAVPSP